MNNNKIFFILFGRIIPYSSGDQLYFYLSVILNKKELMNKKKFQKKIIVATSLIIRLVVGSEQIRAG